MLCFALAKEKLPAVLGIIVRSSENQKSKQNKESGAVAHWGPLIKPSSTSVCIHIGASTESGFQTEGVVFPEKIHPGMVFGYMFRLVFLVRCLRPLDWRDGFARCPGRHERSRRD
jgi:hypothetical protein